MRGQAYNGFPPMGCAARFAHVQLISNCGDLRSSGVWERQGQWVRSVPAPASPNPGASGSPLAASLRPLSVLGFLESGPGGLPPSTPCASRAGPEHGCIGAGKCGSRPPPVLAPSAAAAAKSGTSWGFQWEAARNV